MTDEQIPRRIDHVRPVFQVAREALQLAQPVSSPG
jgi:hypothetical protein